MAWLQAIAACGFNREERVVQKKLNPARLHTRRHFSTFAFQMLDVVGDSKQLHPEVSLNLLTSISNLCFPTVRQ